MADILKWSGYTFCVKPTFIQGIRDIAIKSSSETEDSTEGEEKYVKRKNAAPHEINFTALLNAYLGVDVKTTALGLLEAARKSEQGYIYMAGAKLLSCQFMAISAEVTELEIAPNGTWVSCEVRMTMKQCSKYDVPPPPPITTTWTDASTYAPTAKSTSKKRANLTFADKVKNAAEKLTNLKGRVDAIFGATRKAKAASVSALNDANKKVPTGIDVITMAAPKANTISTKVNTTLQNLQSKAQSKAISATSKIVSLKK